MAPPGAASSRTTAPAGCSCPSPSPTGQDREVRVPPGVTVFDSASWNGIAIDSTCGGHGTCHKCKVRLDVRTPDLAARPSYLLRDRARQRLAAGLPGHGDPGPQGRGAAADHAAQGGHRRRRTPGDPATGRAEALRRARRPLALRPAHRPGPADRGHRRPRADRRPAGAAPAAEGAARGRLQGDRRGRRRGTDRRRAGRHHRPALRDRLRPRHHHRRGDAARPRHRAPRSRSPRG